MVDRTTRNNNYNYNDPNSNSNKVNSFNNFKYQKLSEAFPKTNSYKEILNLDLSSDKYNILNLDELEKDSDYRQIYSQINFLDLSKNSLSILRLKSYNNLEKIIAIENHITKVELSLPRLKKLDLSCNFINKLFELNSVTSLEELILNKNSISKITSEDFKPIKSTLITLEVMNNHIDFSSVKVFYEFIESFGKSMKKLKNLNINYNNFSNSRVYRDYQYVILNFCPNLKTLNNNAIDISALEDEKKDINIIKNQMIKLEKTAESSNINNELFEEQDLTNKNNNNNNYNHNKNIAINLTNISQELEDCNAKAQFSQSNVQRLVYMIENYILKNKNTIIGEEFSNDNDNLEDPELNTFENIIEYIELLINSNQSLEKLFCDLILRFSIIKNGKFAPLVINFIKSRISPLKANEFSSIIDDTLINYVIENNNEESIYPGIITGIQEILIEARFWNLIEKMLNKLINIIIRLKAIQFVGYKSDTKKNKNLFLEAISFIEISISYSIEKKNLINIIFSNSLFIDSVSYVVKSMLYIDDLSLSSDTKAMIILNKLLLIVKHLCSNSEFDYNKVYSENVLKIVGSGLKDKLEQALSNKISALNKNIMSKVSIENKENLLNKKMIFGNLMRAYGAILGKSHEITRYISDGSLIPSKIINLLVQNTTCDPIIVSAACDFVYYILNNKDVINNKDNVFEKINKKIFSLRYTLPFIGSNQSELKAACFSAESYGENSIVKGKPIEFKNLNSNIMHNLFCSVITLIGFYQQYSSLDFPIKDICNTVCIELNEQNRDTFLCSSLSIPNNHVKLKAVECLYWVDPEQFSTEEIAQIYSQVKNISLIGGVIEKVVSIIFLFLTKSFRSYIYNSIEKVNQNKEAFSMAFELLQKNLESMSSSEHDMQIKNNLSLSLITFLVNLSAFPQIKKIYLDKNCLSKLSRSLSKESKYYFQREYYPIEIEKCRSGFSINGLFKSIYKDKFFNAYSYVNLRLYIHMADMLMNIPFKVYNVRNKINFNACLDLIKKDFKESEINRINIEKENFVNILIEKNKLLNKARYGDEENYSSYKQDDYIIYLDDAELIEEQTSFVELLPELFSYLLGRNNKDKISFYENCWNDKFDKKIDLINYNANSEPKNNDYCNSVSKNEMFEFSDELKDENMKDVLNTFKNYLREEEYYNFSNNTDNSTHDYILEDLNKYSEYGKNDNNLLRIETEETPHNPYLRSLCISSFLRCIYALLEYPSNSKIKHDIISLLSQDNYIKDLSKLVDSTKLLDCNISTKYLIIVKYILSNSKIFYEETLKKINYPNKEKIAQGYYLNKLGIISYMIKKIIKVFKSDLKLENNNHKLLISEISIVSSLVCNELETIEFENDNIKKKILQSMITFDLIKIFINAIKENMNYESNLFKEAIGCGIKKENEEEVVLKNTNNNNNNNNNNSNNNYNQENNNILSNNIIFKEDPIMTLMMTNMSNIIGEYMSKCPEYSYSILEMMTKSYIFEKVNFRKTYLKEIIEAAKFSNFKSHLEKHFKRKFFYAGRCKAFFNMKGLNLSKLFLISEAGISFIDHSGSNNSNNILIDDYEINLNGKKEEQLISFSSIILIVLFEYEHRCILRTIDGESVLFYFYKANTANYLLQLVRFYNSKISIYDKVKIFDSDKLEFVKEQKNYAYFMNSNKSNNNAVNMTKDKQHNILNNVNNTFKTKHEYGINNNNNIDENTINNDNNTNSVTFKALNNNIDMHKLTKNKTSIDNNNINNDLSIILQGCIQINKFFDFITEMFADTQFIPDVKVLLIKGTLINVYREQPSLWDKLNIKEILDENVSYDYSVKTNKCIGDFTSCYKHITSYNLSEVKQIKFRGADEVMFNTDSSSQYTLIKVDDDISFLKLKKALVPGAKNKGLEILDDPYSIIK